MIQGYPVESSGYPGDSFSFCVSTDAPQFRIDFYRQGGTLDFKTSTDWMPGIFADDHDATQDWGVSGVRVDGKVVDGWASHRFVAPADWESGVYIAMFVEGDGGGNPNLNQEPPLDRTTADARTGKALIVIKNPAPGVSSQMLYKIPLFTYQMYNMSRYTGIDSLVHAASGYGFGYAADPANPQQPLTDAYDSVVTLRRPGGGTGGTPWDSQYFPNDSNNDLGNWDPLDAASYRQTFVHWDAKMVRWLETNGYRVDYCTDLDIHQDSKLALLSPYSVVLSIGHDEYYSTGMRDNLEAYVSKGGNIAFLSGNTSFWRLEFPNVTANGQPDLSFIGRFVQWAQVPSAQAPTAPNRPEDSLTGVRFGNAGERNDPLPSGGGSYLGFTVQHVDRWPFEGSGLKENDTFGKNACIVGYECDGTPYPKNGQRPVSPTFELPSTPPGLVILGTADTSVWTGPSSDVLGTKGATMAMYQRNGTVFTGATTDWPRVLEAGEKNTIQITNNVLNRLGGNPKGFTNLFKIEHAFCADSFYSGDDQFRHAIVGAKGGTITEIFFNPAPGEGLGATELLTVDGLIDLGAFYTPDDKMRHVLALSDEGDITEIYYNPNTGISATPLPAIPNAFRIAGFFSDDDGFRHAICATTGGDVIDLRYGEGAPTQTVLLSVGGIIDIGCFYSQDDKLGHVIVAVGDGTITEIYYNGNYHISATPIGNIPGPAKVSAYYADDDKFFNRRAQVLATDGRLHEIRYGLQTDIVHVVLITLDDVGDIGGFYSADDHFRHAVVLNDDGSVQELFFNP